MSTLEITALDPPSTKGNGQTNGHTPQFEHYRVVRRDGREAPFRPDKIAVALAKAFLAAQEQQEELSARSRETIAQLTANVVESLTRRRPHGGELHIEEIQDQVELALMRAGEHAVARGYVLYRNERAKARESQTKSPVVEPASHVVQVTRADGSLEPLDMAALKGQIAAACANLEHVSATELQEETLGGLYDGIPHREISGVAIMAARARIENAPEYAFVAARLLLDGLCAEVLQTNLSHSQCDAEYAAQFSAYIEKGVAAGRLAPILREFDLEKLAAALAPKRDLQFAYIGLQTLYDRYLIHIEGKRIELPQWFWMRVAMGLAQREIDREARAIEFYNVISSFRFVPSTPTLFNSGTAFPQLSSCYLTTIGDDLSEIYDAIRDNALLSKFSGGLGNDWTPVRGLGAHIKSTNGQSQGIVPFLKVANDTAVAVNQGGKRQGAVCAYIEPWHSDVEDFLDLRKNTGDDRRRTHDMHTALWMPDLFFERVQIGGNWTLFSPDEVPDLHDLYGRAFSSRYAEYEAKAARGELRNTRTVPANELWRKILTRLFETGHPWITFKDAANLRSPQQHCGVVHSSNLCTEITLNTNRDEIAVCNLGSVNLAEHTSRDGFDHERLGQTVRVAMRMLDNVIDINLYPVPEARASNLRHRPVGLGVMGFQDALQLQRIAYGSDAAMQFADTTMEAVSYHALLASSELAKERGAYSSYRGSLWDQGILPLDSLELLAKDRDELDADRTSTLDWQVVRDSIAVHGMRNSNCMAIAPTATISNIVGVSASIEPNFANLYAKSNLSGEFTIINPHLVEDLRERGLWDKDMVDDLKYFDGVLGEIDRIPSELRVLYATAFEIEPHWLIEAASRRQKWIDMGQSLNLYVANPTGPQLAEMYLLAWRKGLKTTYYLRSKAATQVEKSTLDINRRSIQPRWMKAESPSARIQTERENGNGTAQNGSANNSNVQNGSGHNGNAQNGDADKAAVQNGEPQLLVCSLDGDCEACQ